MYPQGLRRAICLEGIYIVSEPGRAHCNHNMQMLHSSKAGLCFKHVFDTNLLHHTAKRTKGTHQESTAQQRF